MILGFITKGENKEALIKSFRLLMCTLMDCSALPYSLTYYKDAMMARRANVAGPFDIDSISDLCDTINCIANVYKRMGENQKALQFLKQSLKRQVKIIASTSSNKGQVTHLLHTYEDVIALTKLQLKECTDKSKVAGQIGSLILEMGKVYHHVLNKQTRAMLYYQEALQVFKQTQDYVQIGDILSLMGTIHVHHASSEKALKCFNDALVMMKMSKAQDKLKMADLLHSIGNCQAKDGAFQESIKSYRESLAIKRQLLPREHISTAKSDHCLGLALIQLQSIDAALECFTSSLKVRMQALGSDHLDVAFSLHR